MKIKSPGKKSLELFTRLSRSIAKTNIATLYGISFKKGNGCYLTDIDNNTYLDCLTAASTNILGYNQFGLAKDYYRIAKQIQNTAFCYSHHEYAYALAESLLEITPTSGPEKKVSFGVSGSDANDSIIKFIRKYTGKYGIIHFKHAYHGSTLLSQCASGFERFKRGLYEDLDNHHEIGYPGNEEEADAALRAIEEILQKGGVGGMIAESIQGDGGTVIPVPGFFTRVINMLRRYNALFAADEVQTGMGRTGTWWAYQHENILPDLIAIGKGLSAGYSPISAIVGNADIIDSLERSQEIFSYGGNPPACHVANRTIQIITENGFIEKNREYGVLLLESIQRISEKYPGIITDVRGRGLMIAIEINDEVNRELPKIFAKRGIEYGIYWGYFGKRNNIIRIQPPFTVTHREIHLITTVVERIAEEIHCGTIPAETTRTARTYMRGL